MARRNPWTAFYWDDWDADTAHLTLTEQGAYLALIKHYYRTAKPLPCLSYCQRIAGAVAEEEQAAVERVFGEFFYQDGDVYRNKRCDKELLKASNLSDSCKERGRIGAETRWSKNRSNGHASAIVLPIANDGYPQPQPQPQLKTRSGKPARKLAHQIPKGFAPSQYHQKLARENGVDLGREFQQFKDHHGARGSTFKDWNLALNTWLRNAPGFKTNGSAKPPQQDRSQIFDPSIEALEKIEAMKHEL